MTDQAPLAPDTALLEHRIDEHTLSRHLARGVGRRTLLTDVARLSSHLAAVDHVLLPAAERRLPDGPTRVRRVQWQAHRLAVALHRCERHLTGDVQHSRTPLNTLLGEVTEALRDYAAAEGELFTAVAATVPAPVTAELVGAYRQALARGPTRPHPDVPAHGRLGRIAYQIDAWSDHLRDALDNRVISWQRTPRQRRRPGLWDAYLLGRPVERAPQARRTE